MSMVTTMGAPSLPLTSWRSTYIRGVWAQRTGITQDQVITELAHIAFSDIRDLSSSGLDHRKLILSHASGLSLQKWPRERTAPLAHWL